MVRQGEVFYLMQLAKKLVCLALVVAGGVMGCAQQAKSGPSPEGWSEVQVAPERFAIASVSAWVKPQRLPAESEAAPFYLLMRDMQYRIDEKGDIERYIHVAFAGTDVAQMQNMGQQAIEFDPNYQRVRLHAVVIWRGSQRLDVTAQIRPRFLSNDQARNTVFSGKVGALIQIPDFRASDRLELAWTVSGANPVFGGNAWITEDWSQQIPTAYRHLSYIWPERLPLRVSVLPNTVAERSRAAAMQREEETDNGWRRVSFSESKVPALVVDDNAAPGVAQNDFVVATGFRDWAAVSAWASTLFDSVPAPKSAAFADLVAELRKLPTPAERAAGALQWVQREIRYVSVSLGVNSHRPHTPDEVIERRYGDCKDTALLMVQLLRALGVEAQPALMSTVNSGLTKRLGPVPWFDHAVAVAWVGGQPHVLDGTLRGQTAKLEHLAPWYGGSEVFVVGGPRGGFLRVPFLAPIEERTLIRDEQMVLSPDAQMGMLSIKLELRGTAAERQRNRLRGAPREAVKRQVLDEVRQVYANADWAEEPTVDDNEADNAMVMRGVFKVPSPLKRSGSVWRHEYSDAEVTSLLPNVGDGKRVVPLFLAQGVQRVVFSHTLEVPAGMRIDEEAFGDTIRSPAFIARVSRQSLSATRIVDREEVNLLKDAVEAEEILAYQQAARQLVDFETSIRVRR